MSGGNKKNIVVYTAIFGSYEGLIPQPKMDGVDYVCFTDQKRFAPGWEVRVVDRPHDDVVRSARYHKILAHRVLGEYETSVYIDGNCMIVADITPLVTERLRDTNMLVFDHNQTVADPRDCVYDEYDAIVEMGKADKSYKDDPRVMREQIERYRAEGYPAHNGLIFSAVLVRRHLSPDVVRTMETWWSEIYNCSRRDQLSFNYSAWKENFDFGVIDGDLRDNRWFRMIGVHRKNYWGKYVRYQLRRLFGISTTGAR